MKLNGWHFWGGAAIMLWFLIAMGQPNFGFVPMENAEAIGFNVGQLILPLIGIVLIYTGSKKKGKALETKKENDLGGAGGQ